jgi:hypothetical protein
VARVVVGCSGVWYGFHVVAKRPRPRNHPAQPTKEEFAEAVRVVVAEQRKASGLWARLSDPVVLAAFVAGGAAVAAPQIAPNPQPRPPAIKVVIEASPGRSERPPDTSPVTPNRQGRVREKAAELSSAGPQEASLEGISRSRLRGVYSVPDIGGSADLGEALPERDAAALGMTMLLRGYSPNELAQIARRKGIEPERRSHAALTREVLHTLMFEAAEEGRTAHVPKADDSYSRFAYPSVYTRVADLKID